jgi:hypothetical protein
VLDLIRKIGSPVIAVGIGCSLALWYLVLAAAGSVTWGWQAFDLGCFRIGLALLVLNLCVGGLCAALQKGWCRFSLTFIAMFVLASGLYSYLFRFEGTLSLAEGEAYDPIPPIYSSIVKGPLAPIPELAFTVTRVNADNAKERVEIVQRGIARQVGTKWEPIGDSEIRYTGVGLAPLVTVTGKGQGELERSYVKLDLEPAGKEDSFMFDTLPYDFYLRREKAKGSAKLGFHLNVQRGKLNLFDGAVERGTNVPVQNVEVAILDERKFAVLTIRQRRGLQVFLAACGVFVLAALAAVAAQFAGAGNRCRNAAPTKG